MNPMIAKELRQRMRERKAWILPAIYVLVLAVLVILTYYLEVAQASAYDGYRELQGAETGIAIFLVVVFASMGLLLLLAPVFSAGSLTIEKEQRTLASLLTTLLTPANIWWGKFVAALLFLALLLATALPVFSLTFALGGVGLREVALVVATTLVIVASMCAVGLYCSAYFRRSVHSTAVSYSVVIALTVVTFVVYILLMSYWSASEARAKHYEPQPGWVQAPLYANPFAFLLMAFLPAGELYPYWVRSLAVFLVVALGAALLALRSIARSGEQV